MNVVAIVGYGMCNLDSVARAVEECGGKARSRGDAMVSPLHGNFVVNRGKATAVDVLALIEEVHDLVAQKTGIDLEREVKVWGEVRT